MSHWGLGLCVTATGVNADQRQHVRETIEAAGGRHASKPDNKSVFVTIV